MRERVADVRFMLGVGLRADRRLTISLIVNTVLTNVALTARALWFKLLIDAVVAGRMGTAVTWAVVLSVSDAFRSWALVGSQMDRQDLQDKVLQWFQEESMRLAGDVPGIEHHERQEHVDRLAVFRQSFATLAGGSANWSTGSPWRCERRSLSCSWLPCTRRWCCCRSSPSRRSWRVGGPKRINLGAFLSSAAPTRLGEHLWSLLTNPSWAKEARVFGLGDEVRSRETNQWRETTRIQLGAKVRAGRGRDRRLARLRGRLHRRGRARDRRGPWMATPAPATFCSASSWPARSTARRRHPRRHRRHDDPGLRGGHPLSLADELRR